MALLRHRHRLSPHVLLSSSDTLTVVELLDKATPTRPDRAWAEEISREVERLPSSTFTRGNPLLTLLEKLGCYRDGEGAAIRGPVAESMPGFFRCSLSLDINEPRQWTYEWGDFLTAALASPWMLGQSPAKIPDLARNVACWISREHGQQIEGEILQADALPGGLESLGTLVGQTAGEVGGVDASAPWWNSYRPDLPQDALSPQQRARHLVRGLAQRGEKPNLLLSDRRTYARLRGSVHDVERLHLISDDVDGFMLYGTLVACADDNIFKKTADGDLSMSPIYALNTRYLSLVGHGGTPFSAPTIRCISDTAQGISIRSTLQFICTNRRLQGTQWSAL